MKKVLLAIGVLTLSVTSYAQQPGTTPNQTTTPGTNNSGNGMMKPGTTGQQPMMSPDELDRKNEEGAAAVAAIRPTSAKLSKSDEKLMMEVAMGGMMQLEMSKVAVQKAQNESVRKLAQAEVEEQTGLSAKLKEIASAKGVMLPEKSDAKAMAMMDKMQGMSGTDFDRGYLRESGVKGHEKLDKVMGRVESNATDADLKALAVAAHPFAHTCKWPSR